MLWIVGKIFPDFRDYLEAHSIPYGVLWDKSLPLKDTYQMPVVPLDFSDPTSLGEQVEARSDIAVSALIVAGYENYVLPAAYIADHFGLPAPSVRAAAAATDKSLMRSAFAAYDRSLGPDFAEITSWNDAETFMQNHSFPVIMKPASLMKSLLITRNDTIEELRENYEQTSRQMSHLYEQYRISQPPKIIIEEFLQGSMHTVAGFVGTDGEPLLLPDIVDCVTAQDLGVQDNYLFSRQLPTSLSAADQQAVLDVASRGIKALRLTSTPAHVEIFLTDAGPKIVEIGARIGGYRTRMYQMARGLDLYRAALDLALDQPVALKADRQSCCAAIELFPDGEGAFTAVASLEQIEQLPSLKHLSIKPKPGEIVGRASQGYKASAVIMLAHDDNSQLEKDLVYIRQYAKAIISPSDF